MAIPKNNFKADKPSKVGKGWEDFTDSFIPLAFLGTLLYFASDLLFKKAKGKVSKTDEIQPSSPCGDFPMSTELIAMAKKDPLFKNLVMEMQVYANIFNQYRFGRDFKRIKSDGLFGACTQKALLTAFPNTWEVWYANSRDLKRRLEYLYRLLRGTNEQEKRNLLNQL